MIDFTTRLCTAIARSDAGSSDDHRLLGRIVADTLAVAALGFSTPALRAATGAFASAGGFQTWAGQVVPAHEDAVLLNAAAAHALDFDDLETLSSAHLGAVMLAAVCSGDRVPSENDLLASLRAGVMTAQNLAGGLGHGHYGQGWHATATIGTFAATAAGARASGMEPAILANAFALAAAQAAGLQSNFGTHAKAMQAGFAAAAATRSLRLAAGGITGGLVLEDPRFWALYGGNMDALPKRPLDADLSTIAPKPYPCCLATHTMIDAALEARRRLGDQVLEASAAIVVTTSPACLAVLRVDLPKDAVEAAFSARYCVAVALRDGAPSLHHFIDPLDADILAVAGRVTVRAAPNPPIERDVRRIPAELSIQLGGNTARTFFAPGDPTGAGFDPSDQVIRDKIAACLARPEASAISRTAASVMSMPWVAMWLPNVSEAGTPTLR